ncbi:MAG: transcription elongation factor GreAB [Pseudomonadales bacterium]|nr:transcription elongation factor GreAB [Pseudomonadales bacterium]
MNKTVLIKEILKHLNEEYQSAIKAADLAHNTATHSESVAENKYDTFGLEASYLAHGQSERAEQLALEVQKLEALHLRDYTDKDAISIGALIELEKDEGETNWFFLLPAAGGFKLNHEEQVISVVTPASPLGSALMHSHMDDEVRLQQGPLQIIQWVVDIR